MRTSRACGGWRNGCGRRGLSNSEFGIPKLCLSPTALGSDWVGLERSTVLFPDLANAGRRFIPLLLANRKLADTLRRGKHEDLRQTRDPVLPRLTSH